MRSSSRSTKARRRGRGPRSLWLAALLLSCSACSEEGRQQQGAIGSAGAGAGGAGSGGAAGQQLPGGGAGGMPPAAGAAAAAAAGAAGTGAGGRGTQPVAGTDAATAEDAGTTLDAGPEAGSPADAASDGAPGADSGTDGDRCSAAVLDPANPPEALATTGDLGTHDPALIEHEGVFYLWQTGRGLPGKTSSDLARWSSAPAAFPNGNPAWIAQRVPGATDLWAPDVSFFDGRYHLYYSASTFGSNSSCIGHATRDALDAGSWSDQGPVVCSMSSDDWNAIDPNAIVDQEGTPWLTFGSFWSGIKMVRLDAEGARADDEVHALASRNGGAIEAAFIVRRCGYYYLFVSFDRCCNGASSTYNQRVGRSREVLGPYVDAAGAGLMQGGGTMLVSGEGRWHGPGHNAVIFSGDRAYNVFHAYDGDNGGRSMLRVAELAWDEDGWPVSGGP